MERVFERGGVAMTSSLRVAEAFDRKHKDVLISIRNVINVCGEKGQTHGFVLSEYEKNGCTYPMYYMDKEWFSLLCSTFAGKDFTGIRLDYLSSFDAVSARIAAEKKDGIYSLIASIHREQMAAHIRTIAAIERLTDTLKEQKTTKKGFWNRIFGK